MGIGFEEFHDFQENKTSISKSPGHIKQGKKHIRTGLRMESVSDMGVIRQSAVLQTKYCQPQSKNLEKKT